MSKGDAAERVYFAAAGPAIVAELPAGLFVGALRDDPDAVRSSPRSSVGDIRPSSSGIGELVLHDVKARLAGLLLDLAREFGRESEDGTVIAVARTHGFDIDENPSPLELMGRVSARRGGRSTPEWLKSRSSVERPSRPRSALGKKPSSESDSASRGVRLKPADRPPRERGLPP